MARHESRFKYFEILAKALNCLAVSAGVIVKSQVFVDADAKHFDTIL